MRVEKRRLMAVTAGAWLVCAGAALAEEEKTCASEHPRLVTKSELQARWPHYRHRSESAAESALRRYLKNKGYIQIKPSNSWRSSHSGPGDDYSEVYHQNVSAKCDPQGQTLHVPSLFKAKYCDDTASRPETGTLYAWDETKDQDPC